MGELTYEKDFAASGVVVWAVASNALDATTAVVKRRAVVDGILAICAGVEVKVEGRSSTEGGD